MKEDSETVVWNDDPPRPITRSLLSNLYAQVEHAWLHKPMAPRSWWDITKPAPIDYTNENWA